MISADSDDSTDSDENEDGSVKINNSRELLNWYIANHEWSTGHMSNEKNHSSSHTNKQSHREGNSSKVEDSKFKKKTQINTGVKESDSKIQICKKLLKKKCNLDYVRKNIAPSVRKQKYKLKNKLLTHCCCRKNISETSVSNDDNVTTKLKNLTKRTKKKQDKISRKLDGKVSDENRSQEEISKESRGKEKNKISKSPKLHENVTEENRSQEEVTKESRGKEKNKIGESPKLDENVPEENRSQEEITRESRGKEEKKIGKSPKLDENVTEENKSQKEITKESRGKKKKKTGKSKKKGLEKKDTQRWREDKKEYEKEKEKETQKENEKEKEKFSEIMTAGTSADITKSCCYLCAENSLAIMSAKIARPIVEQQSRGTQVTEKRQVRTVQSSVKVRTCDRSTDCPRSGKIKKRKFKFKSLTKYMKTIWPAEKSVGCGTDTPIKRKTKRSCGIEECRRYATSRS